jgi:hypothetical protein
MEHEGWMKVLAPAWTAAKANVAELEKLREAQMQLQMRGIVADASAAQFPLLTAKIQAKDVTALKKSFARQGFVAEIGALEGEAKKFAAELGGKHAGTPSAAWKLLMSARPEVVLWVAYSTKLAALHAKFKNFYTEWPQARQKIPYVLMQEMRIVPGVAKFDELVEILFFQLMDGKLGTVEEMKAFLEPYSPPAPPPPVHLRRARAAKKEPKVPKARKKAAAVAGAPDEGESRDEAAAAAAGAGDVKPASEKTKVAGAKPVEAKAAPAKAVALAKAAAPAKQATAAKAVVPAKVATKTPVVAKKAVAAKPAAKKAAAKKAVPAKKAVARAPAKKTIAKKTPAKKTPAKKTLPKPVAKKAVAKKVVAKKGSGHSAKKEAPAKSSRKPAKSAGKRR